MKGNCALLILGAVVLVQLSHPAPTQIQSKNAENSIKYFYEEESEEEMLIKNVTERHRLYNLRRDQIVKLANITLQEANKYLKSIVKELKTHQNEYPLLGGHINNLTKFTDDMDILGENPSREQYKDLINNFDAYMNIYKTYETIEKDQPTGEGRLIEKLLDGTGWNYLMLGFSFGFIGVAMNVTKEVKGYVDSLTEQQRVQESELIEWYNKQNFDLDEKH